MDQPFTAIKCKPFKNKIQGEFIIHPDKKDLTPGIVFSLTIILLSTLTRIPSEHILPTDYNRPILQ